MLVIAMKNKYIHRSKISEAKFRQLIKCFCLDLNATRERQVYEQDLLPRAEVVREIGQAFHIAKPKFLTIPTAISGIVAIEDDAAVCKEIIEGSIREILAELSSQIATGFGKEEGE